jgi:hypothetical protein
LETSLVLEVAALKKVVFPVFVLPTIPIRINSLGLVGLLDIRDIRADASVQAIQHPHRNGQNRRQNGL